MARYGQLYRALKLDNILNGQWCCAFYRCIRLLMSGIFSFISILFDLLTIAAHIILLPCVWTRTLSDKYGYNMSRIHYFQSTRGVGKYFNLPQLDIRHCIFDSSHTVRSYHFPTPSLSCALSSSAKLALVESLQTGPRSILYISPSLSLSLAVRRSISVTHACECRGGCKLNHSGAEPRPCPQLRRRAWDG